jgi:hypothetical protein
MAGKKKVV